MAVISVRRLVELDEGLVLAPERYHPLRRNGQNGSGGIPMAELVAEVREVISPSSRKLASTAEVLLFDTSDAREGFLEENTEPVELRAIGSAKKVFRSGDVLISRLRPYLRQVAFVDERFGQDRETILACSTEFFVLRSRSSKQSAAFLVPFLLSAQVQEVLAAAQEGGHHPRVRVEALMSLIVPAKLLKDRAAISRKVSDLAAKYGQAQAGVRVLTESVSLTSG